MRRLGLLWIAGILCTVSVGVFILSLTKQNEIDVEPSKDLTRIRFATNQDEASEPKIKTNIDLESIALEQEQVDEGHSPWKLSPLFVTQVFASLLLEPEGMTGDYPIGLGDLTIVKETPSTSIVAINNEESIAKRVYLERLIRQDESGIWTVMGYDVE